MKLCSTCGEEKTSREFYRDVSKNDGLANDCKQCSAFNKDRAVHLASIADKTCNKCKIVKPLEEFIRDERTTLGYGMYCLECAKTKRCRGCWDNKDVSLFRRSDRSADGFSYRCRECINARNREIKKERYRKDEEYRKSILEASAGYRNKKTTREGKRERTLLQKYGLTLDDYEEMVASQDGKCALCGESPENRGRATFSVDHNHDCCSKDRACKNCVRKLLCDPCNMGLGCFRDDMELLTKAVKYLSEHTNVLSAMSQYFG